MNSIELFMSSQLPAQIKLLFITRHELVRITEVQVREQISKLYVNMYKQLFDVSSYLTFVDIFFLFTCHRFSIIKIQNGIN